MDMSDDLMNEKTTITTDFEWEIQSMKTTEEVFKILLDVRKWWSGFYSEEINGKDERVDDVFTFKAGNHYSKQRLVQLIPQKRIVWEVVESNLGFVDNNYEWLNTQLIFIITKLEDSTKVLFVHKGLTPMLECFQACSSAWTWYWENRLSPLLKN
jgi:hypothetical protein